MKVKIADIQIKAKGRNVAAPALEIEGKQVVVTGRWLKTAEIHDEDWHDGEVNDPEAIVAALRKHLKADIFTFAQKLPDTEPKYPYPFEWDNLAVIPVTTYQDWWEQKLPQVTRKSIRKGSKLGVTAKVVEFDEELVAGIVEIHNETKTRQGEPFYHYGKSFDVVKQEYGTFPDRSIFLGAYFEQKLIGIIKMVCMKSVASIMQIITMTRHYDKKPTNILIAKAVEVCEQNKIPLLVYRKYVYGNKTDSSLTEFKRRNGFAKIDLPRYYIPLTLKGRAAMKLKLHLGLSGMLPNRLINFLLSVRSAYYCAKLKLLDYGKNQTTQQQDMKRSEE